MNYEVDGLLCGSPLCRDRKKLVGVDDGFGWSWVGQLSPNWGGGGG